MTDKCQKECPGVCPVLWTSAAPFVGLGKEKAAAQPSRCENGIMLLSVAKNALLGIFSVIPHSSIDQSPLSPGLFPSFRTPAPTEHKAAGWSTQILDNSTNSMNLLKS